MPVLDDEPEPTASYSPEEMLQQTIYRDQSKQAHFEIIPRLAQELKKLANRASVSPILATRAFIELQLIDATDPLDPYQAERELPQTLRKLDARIRDLDDPLVVAHTALANLVGLERNWSIYFNYLKARDGTNPESHRSVLRLCVDGYLSPQYLITGLLPRFNESWEPILEAYEDILTTADQAREDNPGRRLMSADFHRYQLSQWNCWLVWGPSIPICSCEQWMGEVAYQFGYGDENNSIPILDRDGRIERVLNQMQERKATAAELTARLLWAPFEFGEGATPSDQAAEKHPYDPRTRASLRRPGAPPSAPRSTVRRMAPVHSALFASSFGGEDDPASLDPNSGRSDGLVLEFEHWGQRHPPDLQSQYEGYARESERQYYTAYLWLMFLVAERTVLTADNEPGPQMLNFDAVHHLPGPDMPEKRRTARLWRGLLPYFVHANIGDRTALEIQSQNLCVSALAALRSLWGFAPTLFPGLDQESLGFYLVAASDFPGCGNEEKFMSTDPLVDRLTRLLGQQEDGFRQSVILPESLDRPWPFKLFYSSCHLPDLIADYVATVEKPGGTG